MNTHKVLLLLVLLSVPWAANVLAADCSALPGWKRQHYYLQGDQVQYQLSAYENVATSSKRDTPDPAGYYPWKLLDACDATGGGGGGGAGGEPQAVSIYGVWHCGNSYCDWSRVRDMDEFDHANHWIIAGNNGKPAVNLVVLSFLEPMALLNQTESEAFANGIPRGMTPDVVNYFKSNEIRVLLSMGGVTYTDSWNQALVTDAAELAMKAVEAVEALGADGLEIDWENGTPSVAEMAGMELFIKTYNDMTDGVTYGLTDAVLTLDLAVGSRYLQELSRRAAQDWLPNGKIDYINAMVPRGEPSTDQWQEHVDGKSNYSPPILPKAPAKIAVSLWLTDGRRPNPNCVDFNKSSQLAKADYVQNVQPNGAGVTNGLLGYMFWAAECPSTRNVCTTPPNGCEGGMGQGAAYFKIRPDIQPLDFSALRED